MTDLDLTKLREMRRDTNRPREHRRKSTPTSFGWWGCVLGGRVESDYNANHDQNMI